MGPKNHQLGLDRSDRSPIPVRPVAHTGQTGPGQADRKCFWFVLYRVSLKLITLIDLITEELR